MGELSNGATAPATSNAAPPSPGAQVATGQGSPSLPTTQARDTGGRYSTGKVPAPTPAATPPPEPEFRYRDKLEVFGREEEVDYSREDLKRELQIARASRQKFKEVKQRERELLALDEALKADPVSALKSKGVDLVELSRKILGDHAQRQLMSPEALRALEAEEKLAAYEAQQKKQEEEAKHSAAKERNAKLWAHLGPQFAAEMKKHGIPGTPKTVKAIGEIGLEFLDAGLPMRPADIVAELKRSMDGEHDEYLASLDVQTLRAKLGEEKVRALIQLKLDEYKASQDVRPAPAREAPPVTEDRRPGRYIDEYELRRKRNAGR